MPNLPEYQRGNRIQPTQAVLGFEQAYSALGKAQGGLAEYAGKIANNYAVEQATIEGAKAGQKPGRKLFPAFTETDQAFVKAYKAEEYSTVARDAEKYLNKTYFDVAKNPTTEGLNQYQQNSLKQIDALTSKVSEENRPALKRDLNAAFESKYYQLASSLEDKTKKETRQSINVNYKADVNAVKEFRVTGQDRKAEDTEVRILMDMQRQLDANMITKAEYDEYVRDFKLESKAAIAQAEMQKKIEEGKGAEHLAEWAEKPATPDNIAIQSALLKQYQLNNALLSTQSSIYKNKALEMASTQTLSPSDLIDLKSFMTEKDASDIDFQIAKVNKKAFEKQAEIEYVEANKGDSVKMSTVSNEALDNWHESKIDSFKKLNDREPSLPEQIDLASDIRRPIPSLNKKMNNSILNGDVTNAIDAMEAFNNASGRKREALSGVSKEAEAQSLKFGKLQTAGNTPGDAYLKTKENFANLTPQMQEALEDKWQTETAARSRHDFSNFEKAASQAAKAFGYSAKSIDSSFPGLYEQELKANFKAARGDWDIAEDMTKQTINRAWGDDGDGNLVYLPPQKYIPDYQYGKEFVQNQLLESTKAMAAEYKELYDEHKEQPFYYELDVKEAPTENKFESQYKGGHFGITRGGDIHIKKIWRNGDVQKGTVVMRADQGSLLPQTGTVPNYYVGMEINGIQLPFRVPKNQYEPMRYVPDFRPQLLEEFKKQMKGMVSFAVSEEEDAPIKKEIQKAEEDARLPPGRF